jgi:hypothetical protein
MTTPTDGVEEDPLLLYEPLHEQINGKKIPFEISYPKVTPKQAQQWLDEADEYDQFFQRKRLPASIKRFKDLIDTNRFVEYLPVGALCFNPDGIVMNGGNRLAAVAAGRKSVGFMVVNNCPSWMIHFFDNGKMRTAREALHIAMKNVTPEGQAVTRLGLRYEEFLFGKRSQYGWADWGRHKDEYIDLMNWMDKREYVLDTIPQGKEIRKKTAAQVSSATCFVAYQLLAWPSGAEKLEEFLDGLTLGVNLSKGNPALTLREWFRNDGYIGGYTYGRREGQMLLLFQMFTAFAEGHSVAAIKVARGLPMAMPYHPDGWEIGCKNAREALIQMD